MKNNRKKNFPTKILFIIILIIFISFLSFLFIHNKNKQDNKSSSNQEANIGYVNNQIIYSFENNTKFNNDNPVIFSWDIDETGTIIYPNKTQKQFNKNDSVKEPGKYTLKVGKTSKNFEIIEDIISRYILFDAQAKSITINNVDDIINIKIGNKVFNKENNNIPTSYSFNEKGRYDITIDTITGKTVTNTYRIP